MKKYKYVRIKSSRKLLGTTWYYRDKNMAKPREIIDAFAAKGYRFAGAVPVIFDGFFMMIKEYDLVFEIEE